jgi:hypothetical protein
MSSSDLDIKYADWCGWGNPAWFLISNKKISGELKDTPKDGLHKPIFFSIIHSIEFMIL